MGLASGWFGGRIMGKTLAGQIHNFKAKRRHSIFGSFHVGVGIRNARGRLTFSSFTQIVFGNWSHYGRSVRS